MPLFKQKNGLLTNRRCCCPDNSQNTCWTENQPDVACVTITASVDWTATIDMLDFVDPCSTTPFTENHSTTATAKCIAIKLNKKNVAQYGGTLGGYILLSDQTWFKGTYPDGLWLINPAPSQVQIAWEGCGCLTNLEEELRFTVSPDFLWGSYCPSAWWLDPNDCTTGTDCEPAGYLNGIYYSQNCLDEFYYAFAGTPVCVAGTMSGLETHHFIGPGDIGSSSGRFPICCTDTPEIINIDWSVDISTSVSVDVQEISLPECFDLSSYTYEFSCGSNERYFVPDLSVLGCS